MSLPLATRYHACVRLLPALVGLAFLLGGSSALAGPFTSQVVRDEPNLKSFRIESATPDMPLCMMLPSVAGECDGFDTSRASDSARRLMLDGSTVVAMGTLREPDANVVVLVYRHPTRGKDLETEVMDRILAGMGEAIAARRGAKEVEKPHRLQIHGREALRVVVDSTEEDQAVRTTLVGLFGAEQLHVFLFLAPVAYDVEASRSIGHMLDTIEYEPGDLGTFGQSRQSIHSERVRRLMYRLGIPLALGLIAYIIFKKRKSAPARRV